MNKKDNPVPSLDTGEILTIIGALDNVRNRTPRSIRLSNLFSKLLQNGVENDNEKPKQCDCDKTHCIMQNNVGKICKYKNVICDPEYFKY